MLMVPLIAKAPVGRPSGGHSVSPEAPRQFRVVGSGLPHEASGAEDETVRRDVDERAWLRLPRGIAFGLMLAIPFWLAVAVFVYWLL
jgi:hypothetical protein